MSGGIVCKCVHHMGADDRAKHREQYWRVMQYRCNHSAFNGYRRTPSDWSSITCDRCGAVWRTKAGYVDSLKDWER